MIAVVLILGQGALCWVGLLVVRSFGAYTEEQRQFRLVLNDSILLLHQYHVELLRRFDAAQRKDAA